MDLSTLETVMSFLSRALMLLLVLPVINYAKGMVAKKQGDDTAEMAGYLTLNPMKHLDLLGSLMILLCGFGWSKPMPINYNRMRNTKKGIILVAITGPLSLFIMSIICKNISAVVSYILEGMAGLAIAIIFALLASISVCIGVIHLLPLPGMDGFTLLYYLTGNKFASWYHRNQPVIDQFSFYILIFLFFIGRLTKGALDPLGWMINLFDFVFGLTTLWVPMVFG
ncbi:MAG: site-2 protease family protein [Ruminococcus sp.]|nr:site-2 protease family protein [Ruminococcus sp.]